MKMISIGKILIVVLAVGTFAGFRLLAVPADVETISGEFAAGGAETFAAHCAECHGSDGKARTAKGKRLGATDFTKSDWDPSEARGIRIITNGKSDMPSFKKKLTPSEIRSVFRYVLKFRR